MRSRDTISRRLRDKYMKYFRDRDDGKTHDDRNGIWLKVYAIL